MSRDAGHFDSPGALARLKSSGADVLGAAWRRGTPGKTEDAWASPSEMGEDEVARDEVMRSGSVEARHREGLGGMRLSRRMRRGPVPLR